MAKIDRPILLEIVRIVQAQARVPEQILIQKRKFSITYLDDHRQRIEEALRRQDASQLNMLFGQLESKVKYQALRAGDSALAATPRSATPRKVSKSKTAPVRSVASERPKKITSAAKKRSARANAGSDRPATRPGKTKSTKARKAARSSAFKKAKPSRSR